MVHSLSEYARRTAALSLLALAGCGSTPPTDFYVLTSLADTDPQATEASTRSEVGPLVGIGPVELPNYLDQPAIVTRSSATTLAMADFDHWAEPLPEGFTRVLAENLAHLSPTARIAIFPWKRADSVDVQVIVRVVRFEVVADQARLTAEWRLVTQDTGEVLSRRSSFTEVVAEDGHPAKVSAMSATVTQLSQEIATAIGEHTGS